MGCQKNIFCKATLLITHNRLFCKLSRSPVCRMLDKVEYDLVCQVEVLETFSIKNNRLWLIYLLCSFKDLLFEQEYCCHYTFYIIK